MSFLYILLVLPSVMVLSGVRLSGQPGSTSTVYNVPFGLQLYPDHGSFYPANMAV